MGLFDDLCEWLTGGATPRTYDGSGDDVYYGAEETYGGVSHDEWEARNEAMEDCTDGCCTGQDDDAR
jgi:hypothetical protein